MHVCEQLASKARIVKGYWNSRESKALTAALED